MSRPINNNLLNNHILFAIITGFFLFTQQLSAFARDGNRSSRSQQEDGPRDFQNSITETKQDSKTFSRGIFPKFYYEYQLRVGMDSNPMLADPAKYSNELDQNAKVGLKGNAAELPFSYNVYLQHEMLRYGNLSFWDQDNLRVKGELKYTGLKDILGLVPYVSIYHKRFTERNFSPWFMTRQDIEFGLNKYWVFYKLNNGLDRVRNFSIDLTLAIAPRRQYKLTSDNHSTNYEAEINFSYFTNNDFWISSSHALSYRVFAPDITDNNFQKRALKYESGLLFNYTLPKTHLSQYFAPSFSFGVNYERTVDNDNDGYSRWRVGPIVKVKGSF